MINLSSLIIRNVEHRFLRPSLRYLTSSTVLVQNSEPNQNTAKQIEATNKQKQSKVLIAAAFASLKNEESEKNLKNSKKTIDDIISNANDIETLLSIANISTISRKHALKVVSTLEDWSSSGKIQWNDFVSDQRFQKLCRILARNGHNLNNGNRSSNAARPIGDDLNTVLSVTGDDEAAKLIPRISLPQMIKVLSSLAQKKRRSTPLLRSLAFNIAKSGDRLDLKQSADVLYAAAALTFPEPSLIEKACVDFSHGLSENLNKSAVVGSALTSLKRLQYKHNEVLDAISDWIVKNSDVCRPQDVFSLFLTLAMVSYRPTNSEELYKALIPKIVKTDALNSIIWLNFVWSLVVLNASTQFHIDSVLDESFINKLKTENGFNSISIMKLLNINAASKFLIDNYTGARLPQNCSEFSVYPVRTEEKQILVNSVLDSLGSLLPSVTYLKSNVNTEMGFLIDGECIIDSRCTPLPVDSNTSENQIRVAFMVYDFHDMCLGTRTEPNGINSLAKQLLESKGYSVLGIPYSEFSPRDKLVQRVQYLESKLKILAQQHFGSNKNVLGNQ